VRSPPSTPGLWHVLVPTGAPPRSRACSRGRRRGRWRPRSQTAPTSSRRDPCERPALVRVASPCRILGPLAATTRGARWASTCCA
jgi:hypothetical protein